MAMEKLNLTNLGRLWKNSLNNFYIFQFLCLLKLKKIFGDNKYNYNIINSKKIILKKIILYNILN